MEQEYGKCKVLEICAGDFGIGGGGVIVWGWYKNMDSNKLQVDFYCYQQPEDRFIQEIKKNDGQYWVRKLHGNKIIQKISECSEIRRIVKAGHYDCIHLHFSNAYVEYPLFLISRRYVKKVICHSHNSNMKGGRMKRTAHELCKKRLHSSQIVPLACSDDAAKWLFPASVIEGKQYTVIKNGINIERFIYNADIRRSVRKTLGVDGHFVVGHVGWFSSQKNHEFLIDTFAEIKKKCSNAVLLLIGGDIGEHLIDGVKEKVNSLGLAESVIFYGNTDRVNELYQAMDCFVFPSRFEGLGIVAIEAQTAGLRTLCSDGVPQEAKITDLLEYMPLSDGAEKWAEKILTYNDGYQRKDMSEKIAAAGYDIKASAKRLEEIYLGCRKSAN